MTFAFQHHHGAMLLKYAGISFISGAVNHGFFSGERSLWTAAIGIVLFVLGAAMEHRLTDSEAEPAQAGLLRTLVLGALLSIGLGFFTGGLQHFPDSPARSAWVVPLGFFISVLALSLSTSHAWQRGTTLYVLVVGALVTVGSYGAWQWLQRHPEWAATGHSHGDDHGDAHAHDGTADHEEHTPPAGPASLVVTRSIEVRMDDRMRFTPSDIAVRAGETIRFVVHNAGKTAHEMVLGSDADIQEHAQAMQQGQAHDDGHSHGTGAAITVAAGQKGELVVKFDRVGTLQMACLIPGHYEAGMRGTVQVSEAAAPAPAPKAAGHDHSTHRH
ncbi:MAG: plastocyanin/azurin family copper-binding protein [Limnohabitans sp.]